MDPLINELEAALEKGNAHATFEEAVKDIPHKLLGAIPDGLPYSLWQLVEHIRITQWDILEFSRDPRGGIAASAEGPSSKPHKSPPWPSGYWPKEKAPAHAGDLKKSVDQIVADRKVFIQLLKKAGDSLHTPLEHGDGQTLFREALLIIDHTAYHTGEIIVLRRLLGDWE